MSGDEVFALMFSIMIALGTWSMWYASSARATSLGSTHAVRVPLYVAPLLCGIALFIVLRYYASHDVRDSALYILFYLTMGAAWVGVTRWILPAMGISPRDDAIERRNPAAVIAVVGALLGMTFCFAGGNIGDGPGWWVVVFSAVLSTGALLVLWSIVQSTTKISDAITIDRDLASGFRLSGLLIASGLILGRAVAGDWISVALTIRDFVVIGWPAVVLAGAEVLLSTIFRPTPQHPTWPAMTCGFIPASIYIAAASVYVWGIGAW